MMKSKDFYYNKTATAFSKKPFGESNNNFQIYFSKELLKFFRENNVIGSESSNKFDFYIKIDLLKD